MKEDFKIIQTLSFTEFISTLFYQMPKMKMIQRIFILMAALGVVNVLLDSFLPSYHEVKWYIIILRLLAPLLVFMMFILAGGVLISSLLMLFRPQMFKNISFHFTHWGMVKAGAGFEFSRQWEKFLKYEETKRFIFLYISPGDAHIIKKSAFTNSDELSDFLQFLSQKI